LTLTVAFLFPDVLSHDSASFAAAASIAEGVGKRYSKELARMIFRSYVMRGISTVRKPLEYGWDRSGGKLDHGPLLTASVHLKIPRNMRLSVV
jgi:hypothetical protein